MLGVNAISEVPIAAINDTVVNTRRADLSIDDSARYSIAVSDRSRYDLQSATREIRRDR